MSFLSFNIVPYKAKKKNGINRFFSEYKLEYIRLQNFCFCQEELKIYYYSLQITVMISFSLSRDSS